MELTERALELLVPIIGDRMKLFAKLVKFQKEAKAGEASEEFDSASVPTLLEERTVQCKETSTVPISVSKRYYMFVYFIFIFIYGLLLELKRES